MPPVSQRLNLATKVCYLPLQRAGLAPINITVSLQHISKSETLLSFSFVTHLYWLYICIWYLGSAEAAKVCGCILMQPVRNPSEVRDFCKVLSTSLIIALFKAF